jgi:cadmium resistance protein CadD (predicted permease)
LVGFFANPKFRTRDIVLGQFAGIGSLFCASAAASLLSLKIPYAYMGLLGVFPILIGGKDLFNLYRKRGKTEVDTKHPPNAERKGRATTVAMVTMANGGDNIAIYTPLFAIRSASEMTAIAFVFVGMTALWCFIARALVNHPRLGSPIRRYGQLISPFVLIGLGVLILYQSGSFGLFLHAH